MDIANVTQPPVNAARPAPTPQPQPEPVEEKTAEQPARHDAPFACSEPED